MLAWVALAWRAGGRGRKWTRIAAAVLVIGAVALVLNRAGFGQRTWTPRPADAALEDVALLIGYDAESVRGEQALDVTLYWFALRDVRQNYKAFVHVLSPDSQVIAQHDGDPGGGFTPTTRWRQGEIVPDRHRLPLPSGMTPGSYTIKAGMYQYEPLRNLTVDPPTADGRIDLGAVTLPLR